MSNIVNPLSFGNGGVVSPLIFHDQNNEDIIVISSETDGGKYVKGGMLYYSLKGVEIFADLDSIITVNTLDNSFTVRRAGSKPAEVQAVQKYVILLYPSDDDPEATKWASIEGRENAYEFIKSEISTGYDPDKSTVIAETATVGESLTVTEFVEYLKNSNLVPEDDFDIEQYKLYIGDEEEDGWN